MDLSIFQNYLCTINIIGLVLYLINLLLYRYTADSEIDSLITIVSLLGGSIGILVPLLIFQRKLNKEKESIMMSTVFLYCIIPIQIVLYFMIVNGAFSIQFNKLKNFFDENSILLKYLLVINIITFFTYGVYKLLAIKEKNRIRIVTLLGLAFVGGELGGLLAMKLFNHKTSKDYFTVGLPLMFIMHIVVLFYFIFCI